MKKHLALLGFTVRDVVTGVSGVVTSISFELYGCVQAVVNPGVDADGKARESFWYDVKRLRATSSDPVMSVPTFEIVPGGQDLPQFSTNPIRQSGDCARETTLNTTYFDR